MTIAARLKQAVEWHGETRQWLVDQLRAQPNATEIAGANYASVHSYWSGEVTDVPLSFICAASRVLGVRPAWLAFGDLPMRADHKSLTMAKLQAENERLRAKLDAVKSAFR